ncbi:MAG: DUF4344 domain-containing metallopeptidase [Pseudomonadota bacterium]
MRGLAKTFGSVAAALLVATTGWGGWAADDAEPGAIETIVLSNAEHTLWHEVAHLLVSELELPVVGQEEDAADGFATLMMLGDEDATDIERLLDVAELWIVSHEVDEAEGLAPVYYDEHDLDAQRGLRVVCYVAGAGPGRAHELAADWGLPEDRAESCEEDFELALTSWEAILDPHFRDGGRGATIRVRYAEEPGPWGELLRQSEILEAVAEEVADTYVLAPGLTIEAARCDEPNAFWDPGLRTVTLCYEILEDFADLARIALSTREGGS